MAPGVRPPPVSTKPLSPRPTLSPASATSAKPARTPTSSGSPRAQTKSASGASPRPVSPRAGAAAGRPSSASGSRAVTPKKASQTPKSPSERAPSPRPKANSEATTKGKPNSTVSGNDTFAWKSSDSEPLKQFAACFYSLGQKTDAGAASRKADFKFADPNGNGLCSLAELEGFVLQKLLGAYPNTKKDGPELGRDLFDLYRPCYIRAFNDAKDYKADTGKVIEGTKGATADDFVSFGEFRLFNSYLCIYAAMYDAFSKIDGGGAGRGGDDRKIELSEWMAGYRGVTGYGFVALQSLSDDESAKAVFAKIDDNAGGVVILEEFCTFLKNAEVIAGTEIGLALAEDEEAPAPGSDASNGGSNGANGSGGAVSSSENGPTENLALFCAPFQPMAEKTDAAAALRKVGFRSADPNGNGLCSLAELEGFVLQKLLGAYPKTKKDGPELGRDLFDLYRPCYIRAFNDAKDYKADSGEVLEGTKSATADDFVSKGEFRLFCAYLSIYASMYDAFSKIDGGGAGRGGDDRKIELSEWMAGYKGITGYGFVALQNLSDDESAKALFAKIDENGGGVVILDEFATFLKDAEVAAGTEMGLALAEDEEAPPAGSESNGGARSGAIGSGDAAAGTPFGLTVPKSASQELKDFVGCFQPLAHESSEADAKREEGFKLADPNGNGLCSLAELEGFVLATLLASYPRSGKGKEMKEPGRDLWTAFRPCYIRAFNDAKDYKADTGAKIKGTKKATDDDFVSKEEFRLFNAYLCVYASMFDAFAKVDGGGSGRTKTDDRRIDVGELQAGYKGLGNYGFLALQGLATKKDAKALFAKIDDNGGGVILLEEWCEYIKFVEVSNNTTLGNLLAADEAGGVGKVWKKPTGAGAIVKANGKSPGGSNKPKGSAGMTITEKKKPKGSIAPPKAPTKDQIAAQEYAALSPLARRKLDAENKKSKAKFEELEQERAYKAPRAPSVGHPGTSSLSPTLPSVTYTFDEKGTMVPDTDRDNRINIGAHRRLEVKIRTRKLLAFGAARRDRAASVMQASQNRIATITGEVDYEQVRRDLLAIMDKDGRYQQTTKEDDDKSNKNKGPTENAAGLKIGATATPELKAFVSAFEPLCSSDDQGDAKREEGFKLADPNGNGLCSLAELEGFALKTLLAAYPKKGRDELDKGRDLWDAFRPCYIRAFNDAKDYKADTGAKIKGTKKATDDDFVSKEEFKLFCVYLILYAAMFDAFAKIDGGGAGRSKDDDKRIVLDEFLAGYKGVTEHGFLALQNLKTPKGATSLFSAMDGNGGGVVLLDEWCAYLKAAEVAANTTVGQLLNADEEGGVGKQQALPTLEQETAAAAAAAANGGDSAFKAWDPAGHFAPMIIRLALNSSMTYDGGFPSDDNSLAQGLPSGGTNNCGLGGATLRFEPEASGDPQNHGLNKAAALLWSKVRGKHPRLSQADLWVLAAYVAVEVLGGPRIAFTGGRFDAKDGSRAPFGDAPSYEGRYKGNTPKVYNPQGSRLLPLDLGPKEGVYVKSGVASNPAREEPTVAAFRAHAKRMGLSDRELVALLLGGRGLKRGRPLPASKNAPDPEISWVAADSPWCEELHNFNNEWAMRLSQAQWLEVYQDSNAKFPATLKPPAGSRCFVSLGEGYDAKVEDWVSDGVALTTTSAFVMPPDMSAVAAMLKANKSGARLNPGTSFKFLGKKMAYHTFPGDGMSYGVISYELADGSGLWLHDFDPANPALRTVKITTVVDEMPKVMAHPIDLILAWDPALKKWLHYYADSAHGNDRLKEDFALAFKRVTELGFQVSADQAPEYPKPPL